MSDLLAGLDEAVAELRTAWLGDGGVPPAVGELGRDRLMRVVQVLGVLGSRLDAVRAQVAAEVARESRVELGADSLAKQQGFRNPTTLIAATTGTSVGDAARLVQVGEATVPRLTFSGEAAPPRHPHVARAIADGVMPAQAAAAIIALLDRVALRAGRDEVDRAERALCAQADGLTLDQLAKVIRRAEAHLDPDGVEPREQELRANRGVRIFERDGMFHLSAVLDPETAAPVKTAIGALVSADFRAGRASAATGQGGEGGEGGDADQPHRSVPQRQADALAVLAAHYLGCAETDEPLAGATVIVRVRREDLESGDGYGLVDGIEQPVSIGTVRRMAAGGGVLPWVFGGESEILDWGREKRLLTKAQKLALIERAGGCAMCGCDPGRARVHHMRWWHRDRGRTDLENGVLLCDSCHHRIHENGWEICVDGAGVTGRVWFIPPSHVDAARRPRLGGRARFDYLAG